jgi:hypothetical protein
LKDINPIRELDWAHCYILLREKSNIKAGFIHTKKREKKEKQRENERGNVLQREYS